ncbi:MAG: hypothetical protein Q9P01_07380 [Anaerolineae bacterium]|nr:hypothetical protein [Anaerolineae bacterium]MDQ7034647.1 hypothetical protein [Anaerolineae bacterium]
MRFFVTRFIASFIGLCLAIFLSMWAGGWFDAPIVAIDDTFLDSRTDITYTRPEPQLVTDASPSGATLRPSEDGQYFIETFRDAQGQTVIVRNQQGAEVVRFEPDARFLSNSAIWIDATTLLLMRRVPIASRQQWSIWYLDTASEKVLGVYEEPVPPTFSPDNNWVVIQPKREEPRLPQPTNLVSVHDDQIIIIGELTTSALWSPDGRWLAALVLLADNDRVFQIWDTRSATVDEQTLSPSSTLRLAWSSDSRDVLAYDDSTLRIFRDGDEMLVQDMDGLRRVLWSPDNTSILLDVKGEEEENDVYLMTIESGSPRYLMTLPETFRMGSIQWASDGTNFTYLTRDNRLYAVDIATRQIRTIITLPNLQRRNIVRLVQASFMLR